jgi:hypothetical protein
MNFQIIKTDLLNDFKNRVDFNPLKMLQSIKSTNLSVDYFSFF